jgi:hypothetical protein
MIVPGQVTGSKSLPGLSRRHPDTEEVSGQGLRLPQVAGSHPQVQVPAKKMLTCWPPNSTTVPVAAS